MSATRLTPEQLTTETGAQRFDGHRHDVGISFFVNHMPTGRGPRDHHHPYPEVFVLHEGEATFTVDGEQLVARTGDVVVVPAGAVHAFRNTGDATLEMVSIHVAPEMVTEWIEP